MSPLPSQRMCNLIAHWRKGETRIKRKWWQTEKSLVPIVKCVDAAVVLLPPLSLVRPLPSSPHQQRGAKNAGEASSRFFSESQRSCFLAGRRAAKSRGHIASWRLALHLHPVCRVGSAFAQADDYLACHAGPSAGRVPRGANAPCLLIFVCNKRRSRSRLPSLSRHRPRSGAGLSAMRVLGKRWQNQHWQGMAKARILPRFRP